MYILRKFPLTAKVASRSRFTAELVTCDLCLGVWMYTALSFILDYDPLMQKKAIRPVRSLIVGSVMSFLVHLVSIGWTDKFSVIEVRQ